MQLETLITQLGITQHMATLSDWRDELLRDTAAALQEKDSERDDAVAAKEAEFASERSNHTVAIAAKDAELTASKTALAELTAYKEAMIERVSGVLASKDPVQYEALANEFITPAQELERQAILAQIAELQAKLEP